MRYVWLKYETHRRFQSESLIELAVGELIVKNCYMWSWTGIIWLKVG